MTNSPEIQRIRSDYVGAGRYTPLADGSVVVNTTYGVQNVGLDGRVVWQLDLGERCLGVVSNGDGTLLASTVHAIHRLRDDGVVEDTSKTRHEVAFRPVPWQDGVLLITLTRIYALAGDGSVRWKYRFREALGESVRAVFVQQVISFEEHVVVGAVDYNSGLGKVLVFDEDGATAWSSEVGPLTSLFSAGENRFVYSLSGYGKFESVCANVDGETQWRLPVGGPGVEVDGGVAMLIGTNESPKWDNWELQRFTAEGDELSTAQVRGSACAPPVVGSDGALYFSTFLEPVDPAESRIDYTSFRPQPAFVAFDYLMRVKATSHRHLVYYYRSADFGDLDLLYEDRDSVALGPPVAGDNHVYFTHNKDLLCLPLES